MPKTNSTTKQTDILTRMTAVAQEALNKLADVPGGSKVVDMMNESKLRLDEMQKKLRGLDALEQRVTALEKQMASAAKKPAAKKKPAARKPKPKPPRRRRTRPPSNGLLLGGGDAQPQSLRDDLEPHRRRAGLLAVELDRQRRVGVDRDDGAAQELGLRVRQVRAAIGLRQRRRAGRAWSGRRS